MAENINNRNNQGYHQLNITSKCSVFVVVFADDGDGERLLIFDFRLNLIANM